MTGNRQINRITVERALLCYALLVTCLVFQFRFFSERSTGMTKRAFPSVAAAKIFFMVGVMAQRI